MSEIFRKRVNVFFLIKIFSKGGGADFTDPMKTKLQICGKTWKIKSKSWGILKFKMRSRNILENMLQEKLLLQKCHVRFILHFVLASERYIWEKAIILL